MTALVVKSAPPVRPFNPFAVEYVLPTNDRLDRSIEAKAKALIDDHPHFRGQCRRIRCCCLGQHVVLRGVLPSYYLKQLAQEALRHIEGVEHIENRIRVFDPLALRNERLTVKISPRR